jgi:phosphate transport system substrate-binding protein
LSFLFGFTAHAAPTLINGAGSTFAAPLYTKWFSEYRAVDPSVEINYQAIGSGGGVRQFIAGTLDFGASDEPMKEEEIKQVKGGVAHIPTASGAVVVTYNIPGVTKSLNFTPDVIADIYLGKITKWDDAKIKALNPDAKLPGQFIITTWRSDGSGTTAVFTEYLAGHSAEFLGKIGKGKSVKFPTGIGGKGNEGVTGLVRQNPGGIGYVELTYAKVNNLPMGAVRNKAGQFVEPSVESVVASAAGVQPPAGDLRMSIMNSGAKGAYPIASYTYILFNKQMPADKAGKFQTFLKWALGPGQPIAASLHYGALPDSVRKRALAAIGGK